MAFLLAALAGCGSDKAAQQDPNRPLTLSDCAGKLDIWNPLSPIAAAACLGDRSEQKRGADQAPAIAE